MRKLNLLTIASIISIFSFAQEREKIEIINADFTYINNDLHPEYWRLIGNVNIFHNQTNMICDSAYYYSKEEKIQAFNNITIYNKEGLNITGKTLNYDGEKGLAVISGNVICKNNESILESQKTTFNIKDNYISYNSKSKIKDKEQEISSIKGKYYIDEKIYKFNDSVTLISSSYSIETDNLRYDENKKISSLLGPSNVYFKNKTVYCEKGYIYNNEDQAEFFNNTKILTKEYNITADSIFFNNNTKRVNALNNVILTDSVNNLILEGNYAEYYENEEILTVSKQPLLKLISDKDTLFMSSKKFINFSQDGKRYLSSYTDVKFLDNNIKGRCDSLVYEISDSLIFMYNKPIVWFDEYQVSSDSIKIYYYNKLINKIHLSSNPIIISKEDSSEFNQIKGHEMIGYFVDNKLDNLDVNGNGQSIYFLKDKEEIIGMNYIESSKISLHFRANKIKDINYEIIPFSITTPINEVIDKDKYLKMFKWRIEEKPIDKKDLFTLE